MFVVGPQFKVLHTLNQRPDLNYIDKLQSKEIKKESRSRVYKLE